MVDATLVDGNYRSPHIERDTAYVRRSSRADPKTVVLNVTTS